VKALLAIFGGFVLTLAVFLSGAAVAAWFLTARPVQEPGLSMDQSEVWTEQPRAVDTATQEFKRLPARPVAPNANSSAEFEVTVADKQAAELMADNEPAPATANNEGAPATDNEAAEELSSETLDTTITASTQPLEGDEQPTPSAELSAIHIDWCANRYRSYRPRDNSYTPYSGGRRICVSPYMDATVGSFEEVSPPPDAYDSYAEDAGNPSFEMEFASTDTSESAYAAQEHVSYCFSRYRSYRPEDNTYQPYGGGPRRQCR
jgi:BA14K-like protein